MLSDLPKDEVSWTNLQVQTPNFDLGFCMRKMTNLQFYSVLLLKFHQTIIKMALLLNSLVSKTKRIKQHTLNFEIRHPKGISHTNFDWERFNLEICWANFTLEQTWRLFWNFFGVQKQHCILRTYTSPTWVSHYARDVKWLQQSENEMNINLIWKSSRTDMLVRWFCGKFLVWQIFHKLFGMKIDKWWMKLRFTSVGDEFL
jgi:hypothetical protein